MPLKRSQFSLKTLLLLMAAASFVCGIAARVVHRQIISQRPIAWKKVSKHNFDDLARYDRAIVVWGANYDRSSHTPFAKGAVEQPEVRLVAHDLGCNCILLNITDDQFFDEFVKRYPILKQQDRRILLLERGRPLGPLKLPPDNSSIAHVIDGAFRNR